MRGVENSMERMRKPSTSNKTLRRKLTHLTFSSQVEEKGP